MTLLDLDLSDRFATAAADAGVSEAVGLRAISLAGRGHGDQAEAILARIGVDDPEGHHWATVRAANLIWNLGRPREASAILDGLASTRESAAERAERAAIESCVDAVMTRCETAAEKSTGGTELTNAARLPRHVGIRSLDHRAGRPRPNRRGFQRRGRGHRPRDHLVSGVAHEVLVRRRLMPAPAG